MHQSRPTSIPTRQFSKGPFPEWIVKKERAFYNLNPLPKSVSQIVRYREDSGLMQTGNQRGRDRCIRETCIREIDVVSQIA